MQCALCKKRLHKIGIPLNPTVHKRYLGKNPHLFYILLFEQKIGDPGVISNLALVGRKFNGCRTGHMNIDSCECVRVVCVVTERAKHQTEKHGLENTSTIAAKC